MSRQRKARREGRADCKYIPRVANADIKREITFGVCPIVTLEPLRKCDGDRLDLLDHLKVGRGLAEPLPAKRTARLGVAAV